MRVVRVGRCGAPLGLLVGVIFLLASGPAAVREGNRPSHEKAYRPAEAGEQPSGGVSVSGARARQVRDAYAQLPLTFVENAGQIDAPVRYYGQGPGYGFYFTPEEAVFSFVQGDPQGESRQGSAREESQPAAGSGAVRVSSPAAGSSEESAPRGVALALRFLGANPDVLLEGTARAPGQVNYLIGNDPAQWRTGLATYEEVVYRELWPGIDMLIRGRAGALKYEFVVRPGARVEDIRLAYRGADDLSVGAAGDLLIETPLGALRDSRPLSYQRIDGERVAVVSRYVLTGDAKRNGYSLAVEDGYDPAYPLVIEPGLAYSTLLGGLNPLVSPEEESLAVAVDEAGNAYVTGMTHAPDFPTTPGVFDRTFNGESDIFVAKLNAAGSALLYSTFLGGTGAGDLDDNDGRGIALDAAGNAYVTGFTNTSDYPTTPGAFDRTLNGGDLFVTKLNAAGSALVYSTFLGGSDSDVGLDVAVDATGNAYLMGVTVSADYPTTPGAFDRTFNGAGDVFVTKLNAAGSALVYSTFLGGNESDGSSFRGLNFVGSPTPSGLALDSAGNAYVVGPTRSMDFPTTPGAFDRTCGCKRNIFGVLEQDAFVTKLNAAGSALVYSTFLGGRKTDEAMAVAVDATGSAYVTGATNSGTFPTTPGAFDRTLGGSEDAFVTKLNPTGSALVYSTYLGGDCCAIGVEDVGQDIEVDAAGNAYITGAAGSSTFPTTPGAFDPLINGQHDVFLAKLNAAGSALVYSSFLGTADEDFGFGVAIDEEGNAYITGVTFGHRHFPTTSGAFQRGRKGQLDGFVAKLVPRATRHHGRSLP